ncbi:PREDICTED: angiotensin-converting enzyme-like isoform X1 [Nicrophorus vespilloides]|uniref:Angiotensin-converting enzyme n=1 Tax=Nicrophorus vespilloides TaxID=110193 RepID=A0ABM1N5D8_NICVS|nr:PREDICTED: angiotensin-converting enzyme-like isoform X1 [Nicrophorus vespilloides]
MLRLIWVFGLIALLDAQQHSEELLKDFIENEYEAEYTRLTHDAMMSSYDYFTNSSLDRWNYYLNEKSKKMQFEYEAYQEWFKDWKLEDIKDPLLRRKVMFAKDINEAILGTETSEYTVIIDQMRKLSDISLCPIFNQTCKEGSEEVMDISKMDMQQIRENVRIYEFLAQRQQNTKERRHLWSRYMDLSNKIAKLLGFKNKMEQWTYVYEMDNFEASIEKLWADSHPLLMKLHKYLFNDCRKKFGKKSFGDDYLIPYFHLDDYLSFADVPYPNIRPLQITAIIQYNNYTLRDIGRLVNDFYLSLGLEDVMVSMQNDSVLTESPPTNMDCHDSSWDLFDKKTYRILLCGKPNFHSYFRLHHELGHIQYNILYKEQPSMFRLATTFAFHAAIGETFLLSTYSQKYFLDRGLIYKEVHSKETLVNKMMFMARQRLLFLPYGYLVDKWRWDVFTGKTTEENWNKRWWDLRKEIQMVKAPVNITEEHLDPLFNFHIAYDQQYINYFLATYLQFQLHRGFCQIAGEYNPKNKSSKPLHDCNYYGNKEVGARIRQGLSYGRSKPWYEVLDTLIGERELKADAMIEYFEPLVEFLDEQNAVSRINQSVYLFFYLVCLHLLLF